MSSTLRWFGDQCPSKGMTCLSLCYMLPGNNQPAMGPKGQIPPHMTMFKV